MTAMRIKQDEGPRTTAMLAQHFDQRAACKIALDDKPVGLKQARASACERHPGKRVARGPIAAYRRDIDRLGRAAKLPNQIPSATGKLELDTFVLSEIGRRLRHAGALQILG